MDTALIILVTAVLTTFGTKLVEQIFKELGNVRDVRKRKERHEYQVARRVQQLLVIAEHFRNVGIRHGVDISEYDLPDEFEGWDKFVDSGL